MTNVTSSRFCKKSYREVLLNESSRYIFLPSITKNSRTEVRLKTNLEQPDSNKIKKMKNEDIFSRYSRQIFIEEIGLEGQRKIMNAKVLVIGAGGLGSPVIQYLAAAGIGTLGVADFEG